MSVSRRRTLWAVSLCLGLLPAIGGTVAAQEARPVPAAPGNKPAPAPIINGPALPAPAPIDNGPAPAPPAKKPARAAARKPKPSLLGNLANAIFGVKDPQVRKQRAQIEEQNIRNMEEQFRPQCQQVLYMELAFLRQVCRPDAKRFAEVAKASKGSYRAALHQYVVAQFGAMQVGANDGSGGSDIRSHLEQALAPLAEAKLGAEAAGLYRQECAKRAQSRRRAVVLSLVAMIDERLVLSAEQREKLVRSLTAAYQKGWDSYLQMFAFNNQGALPAIRDETIVPLLTERQNIVWQQVPKQSGVIFWGCMVHWGGMPFEPAELQDIANLVEEGQDGK